MMSNEMTLSFYDNAKMRVYFTNSIIKRQSVNVVNLCSLDLAARKRTHKLRWKNELKGCHKSVTVSD